MKVSNNFNLQLPLKDKIQSNNKANINFDDFLKDSINKLNSLEKESNNMDFMLASGEVENIHDVMIASQKSEIALQFTIEIRNKVMDAYKEIMRIQI